MIRKNIVANMAGRVWGFISVFLFIPLYLKFLGIESYGLVGFYSTLLGVLAFADMGFSATINREMARLSVKKDPADEMRDLLRTYELTYLCISLALAILIYVAAPLVATRWLRFGELHPTEVTTAIQVMGIAIAFQLPSSLYIGGLMGLQLQVRANSLQIFWGIYRGCGTVVVLWLVSPTIFYFACWQVIANGVYCFLARKGLWRALTYGSINLPAQFRWQVFSKTWRYATGMAGMAIVSILLTQIDKLAVSKMLPLEMLGYYSLAGSLALIPLILASPIASAVFPRLVELVALGENEQLSRLYHRTCEMVAVAIIPAGLIIILFTNDFIRLWTGSAAVAEQTWLVAALLVSGYLLQALTLVPYYLALAHGSVKLNLQIGVISVFFVIPLLIYLITKYGIIGAGLSWLIMNICTFPPYMYLIHRKFLPSELIRWSLRSLCVPFVIALPCVLIGHFYISTIDLFEIRLILICLLWILTVAITAITLPDIRKRLKRL